MKGNASYREKLEASASKCEREGTIEAVVEAKKVARAAAYAADAADAYAAAADAVYAAAAARDEVLSLCAETGIEALRAAGSPGVELMDQLCPIYLFQ